ncbi:hypothetical protein LSH36_498g02008 [Paralvinella palmiformis]|uniref:Kringle domain-containing protein n=1 Tax=Paralvinella palmiformis TaxID=53620 RepID=A0AAD9J9H9_9ANNE|nr:hypothetical protein LSH36_498g02008 [Paralvinella palmiformis]
MDERYKSETATTGAASWEMKKYVSRDEDYEDAITPRTLKEYLIEYASRTTLHGHSYVMQPTPFVLRRVLWLIYITLSTTYFFTYASQRLIQFLEFQKNSLVEVQYRSNVSFPSITICNQNPLRLTALIDAEWYETAMALSVKANNTEETCSLIYIEGNGTNSTLAFNRTYLRHNTGLITGGDLYITTDEPFIYLFYRDGWWLLTDKHEQGFIYAKLEFDDVPVAKLGTQEWLVNSTNKWFHIKANVACALSFPDLLSFPQGQVKGLTDMLVMYENASHRMEDMLTSCIWKGKYECSEVGNVLAIMTTMGKCFTIQLHQPVAENAGPNYGLSITLNVQHYEYMKRSKQGFGVKILLHEPEVAPRVRELGLSLSPGIVSQLALESTKAPWGDCVDLKLKYYDVYDKSKCIAECETDYLKRKCGCRIFYMPHNNDLFRKTKGHCIHCTERCIKTNYVSSSSFALMGAELGGAQNLRTYSLGKELVYAREKTYRNIKSYYQTTLKTVHKITTQISQMVKFFDILETQADLDYAAIFDIGLLIKYDCTWSKDVVKKVRQQLEYDVANVLKDVRYKLLNFKAKLFPNIDSVLQRYVRLIDDFKQEHGLTSDDVILDFRTCEADCLELGKKYRGNKRLTLSGRMCQRWDSQLPHEHGFTSDQFPDNSLGEASNFCRNPDQKPTGPWCYTTDPDTTWETCALPMCHGMGHHFGYSTSQTIPRQRCDYRGNRATTYENTPCQRWDSQYPHPHNYTSASYFLEKHLSEVSNYCRNPDNSDIGPWCYTADPNIERQYCGLQLCEECRVDERGRSYKGIQSTTKSGRQCQQWTSQLPHAHGFLNVKMFPDNSLTEAHNYCRNPDGKIGVGPWCYTTDPSVEWESCQVPLCVYEDGECLFTDTGHEYSGNRSRTVSGKVCQGWFVQYPHKHNFTDPDLFPDKTLIEAKNYCRNPNRQSGTGPWCFTLDPDTRIESCGLSRCLGKRITTKSGLNCQRWDMQIPHKHPYTDDDMYPDASVTDAANFCRNPSNDPALGPWCYTTDPDVRRETCAISKCSDAANYCRNPDKTNQSGPWCFTMDIDVRRESCGIPFCNERAIRPNKEFTNYTGRQSVTAFGRSCQYWSSQKHHPHNFTDPARFPDRSLLSAINYCRNPDGKSSGPWCYTMDPDIEWETCGIPLVSDCRPTYLGTTYKGSRSRTVSGHICHRWDATVPYSHGFTAKDFPDESLSDANNYCRNPDGDSDGPWCYTIDPIISRETCGIHLCLNLGRQCQRWDSQYPHNHNYTDNDFPDASITDANNYCRNPDRKSGSGPWCFTMDNDVPWESCGVPFCREKVNVHSLQIAGQLISAPLTKVQGHELSPVIYVIDGTPLLLTHTDLQLKTFLMTRYQMLTTIVVILMAILMDLGVIPLIRILGEKLVVSSCAFIWRWDSLHPDQHSYSDEDFPDQSITEAANFCRNPDKKPGSGPWCFTMDSDVVWESCGVPFCNDKHCKPTHLGTTYKGTRSRTASGHICHQWNATVPYRHGFTAKDFPDDSLSDANNYCRNPDDDPDGPWCYTIDPNIGRETCAIPLCERLGSTTGNWLLFKQVGQINNPTNLLQTPETSVTLTLNNCYLLADDDDYVTKKWLPPRCDYYLYRSITRYNQTLIKTIKNFISSLRNMPHYNVNVHDIPEFVLNKSLLEPIQANLPLRCIWCLEYQVGASLTTMLSKLIANWTETVPQKLSSTMLSDLETTLQEYNNIPWLRDLSAPVETDTIRAVRARFSEMMKSMKESGTRTQSVIQQMTAALHMTQDILEYSWVMQCNKEITKLFEEYENYRIELKSLLAEYRPSFIDINARFQHLLQRYRDGEISLEELSKSFDLHEIENNLYGAKINLVRLMDIGHTRLRNIEEEIGQIYYTIMAYIKPEYISTRSFYWNHIGLKNPDVVLPTLQVIQGIPLPISSYGIDPNEDGNSFWKEKTRNIRVLVSQFEKQVTDLNAAIIQSKHYFRSYTKGNQINREFFTKNFLHVDLFYQDMSHRKVVETKVYEYSNLLSDVGGLMGLLLGASVLTIGEILDLLIYNSCKKCKRDKENHKNDITSQ